MAQLNEAMSNNDKITIIKEEGEEKGFFYIIYTIENINRFIKLVANELQIKISFAID